MKGTAILILASVVCAGCARSSARLVIGMVPSSSPALMLSAFSPLKEYLRNELGLPVEVSVAKSYQDLIRQMARKEVDIGLYGPFSYILAEEGQRLSPLVLRDRRDLGLYYNSTIVARSDSAIHSIEDLRGQTMSFVDPASTSGFLVPDALFISRQVDIEKFFSSYHFAGTHDKVLDEVLQGRAAAGAVSLSILNSRVAAGSISAGDLRELWRSESIPGSPFVARSGLSSAAKEGFIRAMLRVHEADPSALAAYDPSTLRFIRAEPEMYDGIRNIVSVLGKAYPMKYLLEH